MEDEEEYDEEEEEEDDRPRKKPRHGGFILDEAGKKIPYQHIFLRLDNIFFLDVI